MALHLEDKWIWDFWFVREGSDYHFFYLQAPRSLKNPELRHWNTSIGHALSQDLVHWEVLPDALAPSTKKDAWDNFTTWTGSTIRHQGKWYMFYTGTSRRENGAIQRIGLATSEDSINWQKHADNPLININRTFYELYDKNIWYEETWRDPGVFEFGGRFYALITARSNLGDPKERGVVALASSDDLLHWEAGLPVTGPGEFAYLEVPQIVKIRQKYYLVFCVDKDKYSEKRKRKRGGQGLTGTHYMVSDHLFGPFTQPENDLLNADERGSLYSGKLIQDNSGEWKFMAAVQYNASGDYIGDISDPMPISIAENGEISVL